MVMKVRIAIKSPATVPAGEFKAMCLAMMDNVERDGASITITKRGRPVAVLSPVWAAPSSAFGFARDAVEIVGDIVGPLDVAWDAQN